MSALIDSYDGLIVDADGVVYRGAEPVVHAIEALGGAGRRLPWCVVTNNAALPPKAVAERITRLGLPMEAAWVVTSPQGAMAYLRERGVTGGATVMVVGGDGIDEAVVEAGFHPVRDRSADPVAVVQGFGPGVCWRDLAEAGYAIQGGALWVATNADRSIPTEHGVAPGNGALVGALELALRRSPDAVTGKPEPLLFQIAASRMGASRPLVLGDRIDTDIRGANRAQMDSLLVLTGVAGAREISDLLDADVQDRPTHLAQDLRALAAPEDASRIDPGVAGNDALAEIRRILGRAWDGAVGRAQARADLDRAITAWRLEQTDA